jgi:hypothetical protein
MTTIALNDLAGVSGGFQLPTQTGSPHIGGPVTRPPLSSPPYVPWAPPLGPHKPAVPPWAPVSHANR